MARRLAYAALAVATIGVGLSVHLRGGTLPPAVRDVLGDALWAMMVAWWAGALAPAAPLTRRAAAALLFAFAIEFSQLYHAPALDALRRTTLGHLVLGSDFDPRDLAAYTLGVLAAVLLELAARSRAILAREVGSGGSHSSARAIGRD